MSNNWRNMKFIEIQKRVGFLLGGWLAFVVLLVILSEVNLIDLSNWIVLLILVLVVPILKYAYDVLPVEVFTLRNTQDDVDNNSENSDSESQNDKQDQ